MTISSIKRKSGRSRKSRRRTPVRRSNRNRTPVRRSQNRKRTPARRSQNRNRTPVRRSNRRLGGGGAGAYIGAAASGAAGFAISKALTHETLEKLKTIHFMLQHFKLTTSEEKKLNTVSDELANTFKFTGLYMSDTEMEKQMGQDLYRKYDITHEILSLNDRDRKKSSRYKDFKSFFKDSEPQRGGGEERGGEGGGQTLSGRKGRGLNMATDSSRVTETWNRGSKKEH